MPRVKLKRIRNIWVLILDRLYGYACATFTVNLDDPVGTHKYSKGVFDTEKGLGFYTKNDFKSPMKFSPD